MWRVVLLVFCYHVVSQAVDEPTRHTRELIECCPCPGSSHGADLGRSQLRSSIDDCPCRARDADSEGASSMFFPRTANPKNSVPFLRSNDPNDMKNLLEPEVGLAKSMLQTLREATEEEYQDALARDAARSVDAVPEESARNVVIIVKPKTSDNEDAFVSEASNIKEARCVNPVGHMRTASKPFRTLPDLFRSSKARQPNHMQRNLWNMDSNVGASNVKPSLVDISEAESKPRPPLFKLRTPLKETPWRSSTNDDGLKTPTVFEKLEQTLKNRPNLFERFNLPLIPKMKIDNPLQRNNNKNTDITPEPSNIQDLIENGNDQRIFKFNKSPPILKNLFKLKDVELIPKTIPKLPVFKSKLNTNTDLGLPTSLNRDADDTCEDLNYDSAMNERVLMPKKIASLDKDSFESIIVPDGDISLQKVTNLNIELENELKDTITSPSEIIPDIIDNPQTNNEDSYDCSDQTVEDVMTSTESVFKVLEDNGSNETVHPVVESKIEDVTGNEEYDNASENCETEEDSETENEVFEADTDSSNNIINVIPIHDSEDPISLSQLEKPGQDINSSEKASQDFSDFKNAMDETQRDSPNFEVINNNLIPSFKPISPLSETLSAIKENVKKSLENLKKTSAKNIIPVLSPENSKNSNLRNDAPIIEDQQPQNNEMVKNTSNFEANNKENADQVTFNDLQKLSDDLLVLSSNAEPSFSPKEAEADDESNETDFKSNEDQQKAAENESDSVEALSNSIPDTGTPNNSIIKPFKEKACRFGFDEKEIKQKTLQTKSVILDEDSKDMTVEASAPKVNTLPTLLEPRNLNEQLGSSLLHIDSLEPLNLNEKLGSSLLPNLDPLNLNEKLRSSVFSDPLNLNEKLASPILPNLERLNLKLGPSMIDPLNLNEKLFQPNLDPLNVRSSLQNIVVQPGITDDPLNILGKPIAEVFKLPTLEDLRQRLSSVFDSDDRSAENNFSDEDGAYSNDAPVEMAPAASTNSFLNIPSIKPLEDMNVDIFQLNPLTKPNLLSNTPRLNLNNFRAKLPIPNNLDLKPVKLESRVGNSKGNVLGASLTFGNDKTLRKAKPNSNLLGHPLGSIPSLDELRSTLQSSTQNFLGTPLHSNLDLFRDSNLRASGIPDMDEIRRNAEKTMKSLQQRMKSTFKGGNINPLSEKFARPQDLLEDMNDKLKAIHYDLNDRLSSIHEDFLDQTRLKPLAFPVRPTISSNRNSNHNLKNNIWKPKGKPARLLTSASTISSREIDPFQNTNDRGSFRSSAMNIPKRVQPNKHRTLLGAESAPMVSKVQFPKPKTAIDTPSKPKLPLHLPKLRQGSENLFPSNFRGKPMVLPRQPGFVKDLKSPILRKSSPFKDKTNKVTITFATTTASPATSPLNTGTYRTTPSFNLNKPDTIKPNRESLKERLALSRAKSFSDAKQSTSEMTITPANSKNNFKTANLDEDLPKLQNLEPIKHIKSRFSSFKDTKDSKLRLNENAKKLNSHWAFDNNEQARNVEVVPEKAKAKPLVWPKTGEDSFLAKVRDAMQARLNNFNPVKLAENQETKVGSMDMIRSASENKEVVVKDQPLKENVSYKCKMVCTRE